MKKAMLIMCVMMTAIFVMAQKTSSVETLSEEQVPVLDKVGSYNSGVSVDASVTYGVQRASNWEYGLDISKDVRNNTDVNPNVTVKVFRGNEVSNVTSKIMQSLDSQKAVKNSKKTFAGGETIVAKISGKDGKKDQGVAYDITMKDGYTVVTKYTGSADKWTNNKGELVGPRNKPYISTDVAKKLIGIKSKKNFVVQNRVKTEEVEKLAYSPESW